MIDSSAQMLMVSTNLSDEELWHRFEEFNGLRITICEMAQSKQRQYNRATDAGNEMLRNTLWSELDGLWREYRVVSAWAELAYTAWVFMTEGQHSVMLDEVNCSTVAGTHTSGF